MIASIFLIKTALLRFGVVVTDVSFDIDQECINVNYLRNGAAQTKSVSFQEIEQLFTSKATDPAGPRARYYPPPGPI